MRVDPRTLGALRVWAGLLVLAAARGGPLPLDLLTALAGLLLAIGLAPRVAGLGAVVGLAFLHPEPGPAGFGLGLFVLGIALLPSARRFSLHALRASLRTHPELDVEDLARRPPPPSLPGGAWDSLAARMRRPDRARTVLFEAGCGICFQSVRVLSRLDSGKLLHFVPNAEAAQLGTSAELVERTIVVIDPATGRQTTRQLAFAEILDALPWGPAVSWVLRAPGLSTVAGAVYDAVARNRTRISNALGLAACQLRR